MLTRQEAEQSLLTLDKPIRELQLTADHEVIPHPQSYLPLCSLLFLFPVLIALRWHTQLPITGAPPMCCTQHLDQPPCVNRHWQPSRSWKWQSKTWINCDSMIYTSYVGE